LEGEKTRFVRPRTILYTVLLLLGMTVMSFSLSTVRPATVTVLRMPGFPYFILDGNVRNQFMLRVQNKQNKPVHFDVKLVTELPGIVAGGMEGGIDVPALGQQTRSIVVTIPRGNYKESFPARFSVSAPGVEITKSAPFLGPDSE